MGRLFTDIDDVILNFGMEKIKFDQQHTAIKLCYRPQGAIPYPEFYYYKKKARVNNQ